MKGEGEVVFFHGNYSEYVKDKVKRLGRVFCENLQHKVKKHCHPEFDLEELKGFKIKIRIYVCFCLNPVALMQEWKIRTKAFSFLTYSMEDV